MTETIRFPLIGGQVTEVEVIERKPDGTILGMMNYKGQTWPVEITEPAKGARLLHFTADQPGEGFMAETFEISGAGATCPPAGSRPGSPFSPDRQRAVDSLTESARRRREIIASITEPLRVTAARLFEAAKIARAVAQMDPEVVVHVSTMVGEDVGIECRFCGLPPRVWHAEDCVWRLARILYPEPDDTKDAR